MGEQKDDEILLTVMLKHQQDKNLAEINAKLDDAGFWKKFPPEGVEVVGWYVMMGIGQVVILKLPAAASTSETSKSRARRALPCSLLYRARR